MRGLAVPGYSTGAIDMEKLRLECEAAKGDYLEINEHKNHSLRVTVLYDGRDRQSIVLTKTKVTALRDKLNEFLEAQEADRINEAGNTTGILVAPEKK